MIPSLLFQVIFYLCIFIGDINYSEDSEVIRRESEILYSLRIPFSWVVIPRPAGRGRGSESLALFSEYHTCFVFVFIKVMLQDGSWLASTPGRPPLLTRWQWG